MTTEVYLILNLALAFYNVGTIWAIEIDIFRSWKQLDLKNFRVVQDIHWKKLPYWIFIPVGLTFFGLIGLFWYHPNKIPIWEISTVFGLQFLSNFLSAIYWGPLQAKLSKDEMGGASPNLAKILKTHWVRTALINAYAFMLLYITIQSVK